MYIFGVMGLFFFFTINEIMLMHIITCFFSLRVSWAPFHVNARISNSSLLNSSQLFMMLKH